MGLQNHFSVSDSRSTTLKTAAGMAGRGSTLLEEGGYSFAAEGSRD
jgi:hypothetical protein